jgi:VWFA-related protein
LFLTGAGILHAQDPVFRCVEVAIVAKDSAHLPVTDLRKPDVRLFDKGVPQTILSLDKLTPTAGPAAAANPSGRQAASARYARRLAVILLDGLNTEMKEQMTGSREISQMLRGLPEGSGAIAIYTLGNTLQVLHPFTTDYGSLRAALANYYGDQPLAGKETGHGK